MTSKAKILATTALALLMGCHPAVAQNSIPDYVQAAVTDPGRGWFELPLDKALHPAETMAFAGVKPGQVIVDLMPEGGYYTRILSKIVGRQGRILRFRGAFGDCAAQRPLQTAVQTCGAEYAAESRAIGANHRRHSGIRQCACVLGTTDRFRRRFRVA